MKKLLIYVCISLLLGIMIVLPASATNNFKKVQSMNESTFSDVSKNSWYYSAVKVTYEFGLMNGTTKSKFDPNEKYSLIQAIVVASRLHSQIKNQTIDLSQGEIWYEPYITYAKENSLLSQSMKNNSNITSTNASRAEIAFLFYQVLKQVEPEAKSINSSSIIDISEVPKEYQSSVLELYKRGIFTGVKPGYFEGNTFVNRAQVAMIISRIIDLAERISFDANYNNELAAQAGNLYMYKGNIVYDKDYTYFAIKVEDNRNRCDIVRRNNITNESEIIYVGKGDLYNLRLEGNSLYFAENIEGVYYSNLGGTKTLVTENSYLILFDLATKTPYCLYSTKSFQELYAFELYGNNIFLNISNGVNSDATIVILTVDGKIKKIIDYDNEYAEQRQLLI